MQPSEADLAYLWDMLRAAEAVGRFVADIDRKTYLENELLQAAVERKLEIIGEAAHKVSLAFQKEHPELPWSKIIGQRNILAHNYGAIDHQRIWEVVTVHTRACSATGTNLATVVRGMTCPVRQKSGRKWHRAGNWHNDRQDQKF